MDVTLGTPQTNVASGAASFNVTVISGSNRRARVKVQYLVTTAPTSIAATLGAVAMSFVGSVIDTSGGAKMYVALFDMLEADMPASGTRVLAVTPTGGSGLVGRHIEYVDAKDCGQGVANAAGSFTNSATSLTVGPVDVVSGGAAVAFVGQNGQQAFTVTGSGWIKRTDETDGNTFDAQAGSATKSPTATGTESVSFSIAAAVNMAGIITSFDPVALAPQPQKPRMAPQQRMAG